MKKLLASLTVIGVLAVVAAPIAAAEQPDPHPACPALNSVDASNLGIANALRIHDCQISD